LRGGPAPAGRATHDRGPAAPRRPPDGQRLGRRPAAPAPGRFVAREVSPVPGRVRGRRRGVPAALRRLRRPPPRDALGGGVALAVGPLRALGGPPFLAVAAAALLLPQISLALLGGWLSGRYGVRIIRPRLSSGQGHDELDVARERAPFEA